MMTLEQLQQIRAIVYDAYCEGDTEAEWMLVVIDAELAAPEQKPVAWQERQVIGERDDVYKWSVWYSCEYNAEQVSKARAYATQYEWRPLYTEPVAAPQRETNVVEALRRCLDELKGHNDSPYCDFRDSFNDIMEQAESALGAKNVDRAPHARDAVAWTPETGYVFADAKNANAAPQREWQGLTPDEINDCAGAEIYSSTWAMAFAIGIEQTLRRKNHG